MSDNHPLTKKQLTLIAALLSEPTYTEAAVKAQVPETTLINWLSDKTFLTAFRKARRQVVETALARTQNFMAEAAEALRRNLYCGNPAIEVKAALALLDKGIDAVTLFDLEDRVTRIEENAEQTNRKW
jgi:predicted transcriptional regulator